MISPAKGVLLALIQAYRYGISPVLPASCRFYPSCSAYALEAVRRHGALRGAWLALRRLLRCHPWGDCGHDPVPELSRTRICGGPERPQRGLDRHWLLRPPAGIAGADDGKPGTHV